MSEVMVIGGGQWQIYLVNYLKGKGHKVCIVNPVQNDTTAAADSHIKLDVKDTDAIIAEAKKRNLQFVTSDQSDVCTLPVAVVAGALGLPGNKVSSVEKFTNKYLMYRHAVESGLPVPAFDKASNADDINTFAKKHGYPVIVKPADSTASRGFGVIHSPEQAEDKAQECKKHTLLDYFVVQKFVKGTEITVEGVVSGGRHKSLTTSRKIHFPFKPGIASSLWYPSGFDVGHILKAHDHFVNEGKLDFGITHAEYMIDGDSFWLMECAARGGGIGIPSDIVPLVTGVDPYDILYKGLHNEVVDLDLLHPGQRPVVLYFCEFESGRAVEMPQPVNIPGLYRFFYNFKLNDYLKPITTDSDRHSIAILYADTQEALEENVNKLQRSLNVRVAHD